MSYYEYPLLIKKILVQTLYRQPPTEIVYRDISRYSWMKFYERIQRLANALESIGAKKGSKVAVIDFDTHRYLEAYFAIPMIGAVLHTVNIRLPPEQILYTAVHAEDDIVLVRDEFLPLVEKVASALPTVKAWIIMSDTGSTPSTSLKPAYYYEDLLNSVSSHYEFPDFDENTEATLFYTSGTTGLPKGVHFTHRQLVLHTLALTSMLSSYPSVVNITSKDVMMPLVPFFHVHSWGLPYTAAMLGNKIVLLGRYDPKIALELIKKEKVTFSHMVPTILHMILNHPEIDNYKDYLKNWKVVIGGAALPKTLALKAMQFGIKIMAGYGLSETAPVLTIANPREDMLEWPSEKLIDIVIKTGIPIPLVELRVIDAEGKDVPRDSKTVGEIVVRTPWLTRDYYKDPEKTKELWAGGWLHTGDIAVIDEYGYIKIVDRIKDVVKSGGEWISSLTLEDLIALHPAVSEVAVIGAPHPRWGERPVAIIVAKKGMQVTEDELKKHLENYVESGRITKWWIPDKFIFVNEIPKTSTGKIDKKILRDQYKTLF
ncbi:MAG: fatty acid--CoA ligase [Thermoprotei archaeon]